MTTLVTVKNIGRNTEPLPGFPDLAIGETQEVDLDDDAIVTAIRQNLGELLVIPGPATGPAGQDAAGVFVVKATDFSATIDADGGVVLDITDAPATLDYVTLAPGDAVLLSEPPAGTEPGVFVFHGEHNPLTRHPDFLTVGSIKATSQFYVEFDPSYVVGAYMRQSKVIALPDDTLIAGSGLTSADLYWTVDVDGRLNAALAGVAAFGPPENNPFAVYMVPRINVQNAAIQRLDHLIFQLTDGVSLKDVGDDLTVFGSGAPIGVLFTKANDDLQFYDGRAWNIVDTIGDIDDHPVTFTIEALAGKTFVGTGVSDPKVFVWNSPLSVLHLRVIGAVIHVQVEA